MQAKADMHIESRTSSSIADRRRLYSFFKRLQDILLSILALVILLPLMLVVAVMIVIDNPGAHPIFAQTRVGLNGKEFRLYKFRTMYPNAEEKIEELLSQNEMNGPVFKIKNDPRITRVGKVLRRTSIDELPQLVNILLGDMSIVGPRPALPRETCQYDDNARQRLTVLPGLTCLWQIQPQRNSLSFEEWLALDMKYIEERSFLLDWKIMFATVRAVMNMEGE
ncbi:MAG: sugar transferase [Clostridiales bacterium]|nr:sugar transferase [Clostridiales bacterium]